MNHGIRARALDAVARIADAGLDHAALVNESSRLLAKALPWDAACWHTTDPATLVETSVFLLDVPAPDAEVAEIAFLSSDYNSFVALASARRHSGVLSEATGGNLDRSLRYRELLRAVNIRGELRASFVVGGAAWGCVSFFREAPRDFTSAERDFAHDLTTLLGRGFRAAGMHARAAAGEATAPGLIMIDGGRRVASITGPARSWLEELGFAGVPEHDPLPFGLLTVAERVRDTGEETSARVLGRSGRWIQLHASTASGAPGQVAIIVQAAIAPSLISATYGLTARERELTELVLKGCGTAEIADRLNISPYTVQGHLTAIFTKAGVRSRRALVAKVHGFPKENR